MGREENIKKLKRLIEDYEDELQEAVDMIRRWNEQDDPMSDPGLQYEQSNKVDASYEKVVEFAQSIELKD